MSSWIMDKARAYYVRWRDTLIGPQTLAFIPALTLGGYWFGGEAMLLFLALIFPAAFAITGLFSGTGPAWATARDRATGLSLRPAAERALDDILKAESVTGKTTAAIALSLGDFAKIERQYGIKASEAILKQSAERLASTLREMDTIVRLDGSQFGIALGPVRRADLETLIQIASRLQAAIAEPFSVDATRVFITTTVGFCLANQTPTPSGPVLLEMAERALASANANGAGSIRAYSPQSKQQINNRKVIHEEVTQALENGQITPWFQPQVCADTGQITGFEALARWIHPDRGVIPPLEFLPTLEELELLEQLSEVVLTRSLSALRHWDRAGYSIPNVAVNFSSQELSNPKLIDRLKWELDRFELTPARLNVEILEDVIAVSNDDVIIRNIQAMAEIGCMVDLDDFGTGHASIANIRRFSVNRIKIDRSFITRVDRDRDQQNMVSAMLTMAERLQIDTIAEGVETIGEHSILAQLGCGHVQGFSIAKPMPLAATDKWITQYQAKLSDAVNVDRQTG